MMQSNIDMSSFSGSLANYLEKLSSDKDQMIINQMIQIYRDNRIESVNKLAFYQEKVIESSAFRSIISDLTRKFVNKTE